MFNTENIGLPYNSFEDVLHGSLGASDKDEKCHVCPSKLNTKPPKHHSTITSSNSRNTIIQKLSDVRL